METKKKEIRTSESHNRVFRNRVSGFPTRNDAWVLRERMEVRTGWQIRDKQKRKTHIVPRIVQVVIDAIPNKVNALVLPKVS
jgi:hypothetical protein